MRIWTQQEIDYLNKKYGIDLVKNIAKKINRTNQSIMWKANQLNLKSNLDFLLRKGKTYEDIVGKRKAEKWKNERNKCLLGNTFWLNKHHKYQAKQKLKIRQLKRKEELGYINSSKTRKKMKIERRRWWKNPKNQKIIKKRNKKIKIANENRIVSLKTKRKIRLINKKLWRNPKFRNKQSKVMAEGLHLKPTKPEMQIGQICKLNNLPFKYTGDNKIRINGFNPDFLSKNLIIEINGERWHKDKNRELRKKKTYNSLGYKLLVIWSKELQNPNKVTEKIIKFML